MQFTHGPPMGNGPPGRILIARFARSFGRILLRLFLRRQVRLPQSLVSLAYRSLWVHRQYLSLCSLKVKSPIGD